MNHHQIQRKTPQPPPPQWTHARGMRNNEERPIKRNESGTGGIICELPESIQPDNCPGRNRTPPTTDTSSYRQRDQRRFCETVI